MMHFIVLLGKLVLDSSADTVYTVKINSQKEATKGIAKVHENK